MNLTPEQIKHIESKASRYGCGADSCLSCYPLEYACAYCLEAFNRPILNGQNYVCDFCEYDSTEVY